MTAPKVRPRADLAWDELVALRAEADDLGIGWAPSEPLGALRARVEAARQAPRG